MLFLAGGTSLRMFIRVLSDSCCQLHLVSDEYYFFIASKIGADCRVMGIATADETAPNKGRFFRLHRTIYTLGVFLIKALAAGCGQLLICTCSSCPQGALLMAALMATRRGRGCALLTQGRSGCPPIALAGMLCFPSVGPAWAHDQSCHMPFVESSSEGDNN